MGPGRGTEDRATNRDGRSAARGGTGRFLNREVTHLVLQVGDAVAIAIGFVAVTMALATGHPKSDIEWIAIPAVLLVGALTAVRSRGLWDHRVTSLRSVEFSRVSRASMLFVPMTLVVGHFSGLVFSIERTVIAAAIGWLTLVLWRATYRQWLATQRRQGRFCRSALVIGTNHRAIRLSRLVDTYAELGIEIIGMVGSEREARIGRCADLWLGDYADAERIAAEVGADMIVICTGGANSDLVNRVMRSPKLTHSEIYLDTGLSGIDTSRLRASPIAHEPVLYVQSGRLSDTQAIIKRALDITVAGLVLLVSMPVLAVIAVAVRATDGGPALFRQRRVGRNGVPFEMLKFRSMVEDAEDQLADLDDQNERVGPLFKMESDPRVTKIGAFLRASSLDELPQLINVLRGDMSLVGPRPAKVDEVESFPDALKERHRVRPGITGMWQVEARDNPHFAAYRQLDLFYVENWSLSLDLILLVGTAHQLMVRPFAKALSRRPAEPVRRAARDPFERIRFDESGNTRSVA